ncbi:hypothetical protein PF005_g19446 [Phytophthora fragariae]|uniref:HAT C-terminal dimerisation domain-containing protein n=1 Tax=Phytophthora fragariae TaxID=53985 RepID=A0A6A3RB08_9STRA|nr:hypothetical protein PF009_g20232 [Phytophthora fragariae]KAE8991696.1 hypothetical protein PF011_g17841 [Phytophthora fragariae]KAE9090572.1 hypothetical protein PF007_g19188 [Phytophthora fragariae]KAE9101540.1 hypothetical protein PF006_g22645 [Phytophthora fragariae]KAE9189971.1 hypothetical protein PF005_g19446 [Phytophthora fragariae]
MNLLIKDVCNIDEFSRNLKQAAIVVNFIKDHGFVAAAFKKLRKRFMAPSLQTTTPTRWYSQLNQCYSLLFAKYAVLSLLDSDYEPLCSAIKNRGRVETFREVVGDSEFWKGLHKLKGILEFPSKIIGNLESDSGDLFKVYDYFRRLETSWSSTEGLSAALSASLLEIVQKRWKFPSTDSMSFAFVLTPKSMQQWRPREKLKKLKSYIEMFYSSDEDRIVFCIAELDRFLTIMVYLDQDEKEEYLKIRGLSYWVEYGINDYPNLYRIAIRVFVVPTSSAASERVWIIYSFLMSKRRNRLAFEKLERIDFIYINSCRLDDVYRRDYLATDVDEDIDGETDEES